MILPANPEMPSSPGSNWPFASVTSAKTWALIVAFGRGNGWSGTTTSPGDSIGIVNGVPSSL